MSWCRCVGGSQGSARNVQRAGRNCSDQADVSHRVQAQPLPHPGLGLLRVARHADRQATLLLHGARRLDADIRRTVDEWKDIETGESLKSCTIIITNANELAAKVHDRMPVLLQPQDFDRWLAGTAGTELLKPAPNNYLQVWPVSRRVNSSRATGDDPTLIDRVTA